MNQKTNNASGRQMPQSHEVAVSAPDGNVIQRLPHAQLRLAVIDIMTDRAATERGLQRAVERLWREDEGDVTATYDAVFLSRTETHSEDGGGRHGMRAERMRELHRPMSRRQKLGLTVADIAARMGVRQETAARLLEDHGYLELSPFGRTQSRRLVSADCYAAGHGHNVDPSQIRSGRLDGMAKAAPFPVFYEKHVPSIIWTLGWGLILSTVLAESSKRKRLAFLLTDHAYLPDAEIAALAGCSLSGVEKGRRRGGFVGCASRSVAASKSGCKL